MYINTRSKEQIEESICKVLNISIKELDDLLVDCYNKFQKDHQVFIMDNQYDYFYEFIKEHQCKIIDKVLFIHLGRRLKDDHDDNGYNFVDLLSKETSLSKYMKDYDVYFEYDKYIKMFVDHKEMMLEEQSNIYSYSYLRDRFGYRYKDFGFKGYIFADEMKNSDIYHIHEQGPEFFGHLFLFMNNDKMSDEFYEKSDYYQLEYLVPIDMICFDDFYELNNQDKQRHMIVRCLQRLYEYKYDFDMIKSENRIVGIADNMNLSDCFLVNKIKI